MRGRTRAGRTLTWTVASAALVVVGCPAGEALTPDVAAPQLTLGDEASSAPARRRPIGVGDALAQACFDKARHHDSGSDAPCIDGARASCARRCSEGEAAACRRLGSTLERSGDESCAAKLFALACDHGELGGCVALASALDDGETSRIEALLTKSCDGGHAPGCTRLGARVLDAGDPVRGQRLLEKGCNEGDAEGCRRAAALHEGPERIALVRKACNLGDPAACVDLARSLYFGIGVVRDPQQAQQLLQQVCSVDTDEDGGEGCFLLAQLLSAQGAGAAAAQIDALYQRACDKEHFDACIKVVNLHYVNADYDKAVELSTKLITDNGSHWMPRYTRGMSLFDLGRFAEAEPDLEQLCALRPEWVYCELWLYAARERAGKDGDAGLQAAAKNVDLTHWPGPVVTFFLGNKGEAQLLREAKSPDRQKELEQLCEAYFYVGQKLLTRGNPTKAMAMFQKAVDTGITNFVEYASARAELARRTPAPRAGP